jgi:uncharacterized protein YaaW (UPF0174 family)
MKMNNTAVFDKDLNPVLSLAKNDDLNTLVLYLKTKFSEILTVSDVYKAHYPNHTKYADLIAKEIRDMGGNSFANAFRGEGPKYFEIVCDVADKLKVPYNKNKNIADIENSILEKIIEKALDKMSESDKEELLKEMGGKAGLSKGGITTATFISIFRAGGFGSYQLTLIIANQIARLILGSGFSLATNAAIARVASILAGPVGWALTGLWTAVDLAGPSYKVTIPCVIHIAMLRKKMNSIICNKCEAVLSDSTMKFCSECGAPVSI